MTWYVTSFYQFHPLVDDVLNELRTAVEARMEELDLYGLVLLASEGINGTVAGSEDAITQFKRCFEDQFGPGPLQFKDSVSQVRPFKRRSVDLREEIVGLKRPDLVPAREDETHLSPQEWHEMMASDNPKVIVDTRNRYETALGKFRGAIDPCLGTFSDWEEALDELDLPKDRTMMIYCTGGIRCEKAILAMRERGYERVFQLRDGILGYLAEYPEGFYEGECFVFDDRVSLDSNLEPSGNYGICPGCGLTSGNKRVCEWCQGDYFVCTGCELTWKPVCSKTCLDRWTRHGAKRSGV